MDEQQIIEMRMLTLKGQEQGKVLRVSEAFNKYRVEEEPHMGTLDYWTKEDSNNEV